MADCRFVICIRNTGYEASLEPRKLYEVIADSEAESHQLLHVVDPSGEDYLYPAAFFTGVDLPEQVVERIVHAE